MLALKLEETPELTTLCCKFTMVISKISEVNTDVHHRACFNDSGINQTQPADQECTMCDGKSSDQHLLTPLIVT